MIPVIAQIDIPEYFPLWAQILLIVLMIVLPTVATTLAIVGNWLQNKWENKVLEWEDKALSKEAELQRIKAERDRDLSQTDMTREILSVHREELGKISSDIRAAATIRREDDNAMRDLLNRNTDVISGVSDIIKGMSVQWQNVDTSLAKVEVAGEKTIASNEALTTDVQSLHRDIRKQLLLFDNVRDSIADIRTEIQATAKQKELADMRANFIEIFDSLDEGMQSLSQMLQRVSITKPVPELDEDGNVVTPKPKIVTPVDDTKATDNKSDNEDNEPKKGAA